MTKILFLSNSLGNGGAEKVLVNLANQLADRGYDITIRTLSPANENKAFLSDKVRYECLFTNTFRGLNYLYLLPHKWIYQKVAHGEYDIIIVYLHGVLTKIISYAPQSQKTVAYLHANMEKSPFIQKMRNQDTIRQYFTSYDKIIAVSEDVKESFIKVSGISENVKVIYNTFDVENIRKKSVESIPNRFMANSNLNLCTVGKLEDTKGYHRLLEVIYKLITEGKNLHLTIVGDGMEREELENYIATHSLSSVVSLVGYDSNPYKYIAKSDLFVCSSFSEGYSSVVAESLILGVPVLTTDCAGMKEMLGNENDYGMIVDNSSDALYQGISSLYVTPALLEHYRMKAKERSTFFSPESTVSAVEKMIAEVLE